MLEGDLDGRHHHFRDNSPDARPDEAIVLPREVSGGGNGPLRPIYFLNMPEDGSMSANFAFEPVRARHLRAAGWVRLGSDDVALLRIARALERLADRPVIESVIESKSELAEAVAELDQTLGRKPRTDDR